METLAIPNLMHKYEISEHELSPVFSDPGQEKKDTEAELDVLQFTADVHDFPDGGFRAWAVTLQAFWTSFSTLGYATSWGVFQAYYQQAILPDSSPSQISWIGSVQRCILWLPGVFVGRLFDLGFFRIPFALGSILIIVGTFLIPLCTLFWHFILCQGFMIGIGCGLTFGTSSIVVTHWWKRRRGLALGVASCGGALGGTLFPILIRQLLNKFGFPWTMRTIGFILILTLSVANICVARRLPPHKAAGGVLGLRVFRKPAFTAFSLSCLITPLGAFTVGTYISITAVLAGLSPNFAFYLVAIHNAMSVVGSVVFGFLGDRLGAMNVLIQTILSIGVVTIVWPYCRTVASFTVISVIYGLAAGAFSALGLVPVAAMGGTEDLGRRMGTINTVLGLGGLVGPPLGGLLTSTRLGYKAVGFFAGGMVFIGTLLFVVARFLAVPKLRSKF
ncbi:major facilitator superfamily domain-containing protein [Mycena crocata]|nr:major facilitator superfamily domain-containing protein [Mycena crocata]